MPDTTQDLNDLGQTISAQLGATTTTGLTVVAVAALIQSMLNFVEVAGPWVRARRSTDTTAA
jgi:hypothetical protein